MNNDSHRLLNVSSKGSKVVFIASDTVINIHNTKNVIFSRTIKQVFFMF